MAEGDALSIEIRPLPTTPGVLGQRCSDADLACRRNYFGTIAYKFRQQWWEMYLSYIR